MYKNRYKKNPKISVPNASLVDYRSESVTVGLGKIADHYRQLEVLLVELESKMPQEPPTPSDQQVASEPTVGKPR